MAKSVGIRELYRPPNGGHTAYDLSIDEVADPSQPHDDGGWDRQGIGDAQKRLAVKTGERPDADQPAKQQTVGGHAAEPIRRNQESMFSVEGPFVKHHLDQAAAKQNAD